MMHLWVKRFFIRLTWFDINIVTKGRTPYSIGEDGYEKVYIIKYEKGS